MRILRTCKKSTLALKRTGGVGEGKLKKPSILVVN
jgi:hypothetical protein